MQNNNKFAIGASGQGDQHLQQENNCRAVSGTNLVSQPVRTGTGWSRERHSQISIATTSCHEDNRRPAGRRVTYVPVPSNQARAFRAIRDDERDDALAVGRRDAMIEWNPRHAVVRNDSAFTTIPYHGEVQHRLPPRAAEQQLSWCPIAEREWRRRMPSAILRENRPSAILRENQPLLGERIQVSMAAAVPSARFETRYDPTASRTFQSSLSWSRGGFPSLVQINSYNQQLRVQSDRALIDRVVPRSQEATQQQVQLGVHRSQDTTQQQVQHGIHRSQEAPQRTALQHGAHREVRTITLSSSTGSSTTASGATCRSPTGSHVGEKRMNDSLASPPAASSCSPTSHYEARYDTASAVSNKRYKNSPSPTPAPAKFDMLDLLCKATLEMGPLQENPSGCSCPKSKCIALYCDCFKAGRRCKPGTCTCLNCKNTVEESGANGARTVAIRTILARNPRAFTTAGQGNPTKELPPGQVACNCIRSRCLKLYCGCFQAGKVCDPKLCTCISCLNTEEDESGARQSAIQQCLEKRPNAFQVKPKEVGMGCACKNNRCIRKYCECFRTGLSCTEKCTCRECENQKEKE